MVRYPVHVPGSSYRGRDKRKLRQISHDNAVSTRLENHINRLLSRQTEPLQVYEYRQLAMDTGIPEDRVRSLCQGFGGDQNGFTAMRADLDPSEAGGLPDKNANDDVGQ
ncbi:hypothetical protein [Kushneria phosphatilytica]|uniref:Uncharacterized protein n=1 Tax=Kushneria phosphatilytica TaxID=657387 RepID=A0A1S1NZ05_9GAMM|nr:hypothetical protein [Kushneria phosphatilytica]OHV12103.1 hypothetical protein BH688_05455 [Kushneria phosphatilytica]QEL11299.1 hypothetical protein FY550_09205 [Kushneria phosphatilytica]